MRRPLRAAALALLALAVLAGGFVLVQGQRRPSMEPYRALVLPEAAADAPLRVRFAGVATLLFDDGETAWMTDGFFSRPGKLATLLTRVGPDAAAIDHGLQSLGVRRLAAVVPLHAHYDHAMDAPVVAQRSGALLLGGPSVLKVGRGQGLPEAQMREVKAGDVVELGRFKLRFLASRHSPTPWSDGVTAETITEPLTPPAHASAWREGEVWSLLVEHASGRRFLVLGSAGFVPGALVGRRADTVFLGVGTLGRKDTGYREAYWTETVRAVGARRVIPVHWDDFWRPLDEPLVAMPMLLDDVEMTLADLQERGARDGIEIRLPPLFTAFVP